MDIKTLRAILSCVHNAKDVIERLTMENWPYEKAEDAEIYAMFYQLNSMALTLYAKIEKLEAANNEQKES